MKNIIPPDLKPVQLQFAPELNKISARYLTMGTVIAILLNPLFGLVDYFELHTMWKEFMLIRVMVSVILTLIICNRKMVNRIPDYAGLLVFAIIVTQDAYFFSMADPANIQQLALAYLADFVGASMVLLWSPFFVTVFLLFFLNINLLFFISNSSLTADVFLTEGGLLVLASALFSMMMILFRYHSVKSMIISRLELVRSNEWMSVQNEIIEEKSAELQKSNNRLKEFAYIVSHDLKAPLRGVRNIASWIREDCGEAISESGITHLELMDKQIVKMENLIHAVLEYSKTGFSRSKAEWINLDEIIKDVIDMVEVDNRTRFTVNTLVPRIIGTRIVISQVLQNLLSNSIKHNDKTIREVEIHVCEEENQFLFRITDNGPGINENDHERIFELFQTLKKESSYDHTGIGLPVARKMIEEAGGRMWLKSEPGHGSSFFFSLPKKYDEPVT